LKRNTDKSDSQIDAGMLQQKHSRHEWRRP
jgi:hypothetical protein